MLVVKVYATKRVPIRPGESVEKGVTHHTELVLIEELNIRNIGERGDDNWEYKVIKPKGVKAKVLHLRSAGYRPLLVKVLNLLDMGKRAPYKRSKKGE